MSRPSGHASAGTGVRPAVPDRWGSASISRPWARLTGRGFNPSTARRKGPDLSRVGGPCHRSSRRRGSSPTGAGALSGSNTASLSGRPRPSEAILAKRGGKIHTAFIERLHLDFRQHGAAIGRRVHTRCQPEAGWRQQGARFQAYPNFCLPHASWRLPLPECEAIRGTGAVPKGQLRTAARDAGLTDRGWRLRDVLRSRVPPWPQP
jgi:hypothetical protein